jgi:hypothetical protein
MAADGFASPRLQDVLGAQFATVEGRLRITRHDGVADV